MRLFSLFVILIPCIIFWVIFGAVLQCVGVSDLTDRLTIEFVTAIIFMLIFFIVAGGDFDDEWR